MANIKPGRIAEVLQGVSGSRCREVLTSLLIESLPVMERGVYNFIKSHPHLIITSKEVSDAFEIKMNYTGNLLGRLRKWGLVISEAKSGPDGLYYEWRIKG